MTENGDTSKFALKDSLCWHCSHSTDGSCSWSKDFTPVDGWVAEKHNRKGQNYGESYLVIECPMFAVYENKSTNDTGYRKLSNAVLANAGKDYLKLMRHEKKLRDNDPALFTKRALYGDYRTRTTETIKYHKLLSDPWKALYGLELFNNEIIALEHFFTSEYAELFGENVNPVYIMESIQKQVGLRHEIV